MPMYEYACSDCGQHFEKLVKSMNDVSAISCPKCASIKTERSLSVFAVAGGSTKSEAPPTGCGRCGGPGPCGMG